MYRECLLPMILGFPEENDRLTNLFSNLMHNVFMPILKAEDK